MCLGGHLNSPSCTSEITQTEVSEMCSVYGMIDRRIVFKEQGEGGLKCAIVKFWFESAMEKAVKGLNGRMLPGGSLMVRSEVNASKILEKVIATERVVKRTIYSKKKRILD